MGKIKRRLLCLLVSALCWQFAGGGVARPLDSYLSGALFGADSLLPKISSGTSEGLEASEFDELLCERLQQGSRAGWINVRSLGARGNSVSNDGPAFRRALALAGGCGGGTVFVPRGDYLILDGPLYIDSGVIIQGVSSKSSKIYDGPSGAGLFRILPGAERFAFRSLLLSAQGGHVWASTGTCARGHVVDISAWSYGLHNSIWHHDNDGSWIGMLIEHSEFEAVGPKEVPAWNVVAPGGINANTFFRNTLNSDEDVKNYFFHLEVTDPGRYAYDNAFRDLIFERTFGGEIRLLSHSGTIIENVHGYDYHVEKPDDKIIPIFNDLIFIGSTPGGNASQNVRVVASGRRGGELAPNVYDLRVENARSTVIDNLSVVPSTGLRIHAGDNRTTRLHNINPLTTVDGFVGPVTTNDGGPAPRLIRVDTELGFQHELVFADASGADLELTLPIGVFRKRYQVVKQGDANVVQLRLHNCVSQRQPNGDVFVDLNNQTSCTDITLQEHGETVCMATVGDHQWRLLPCGQ